MTESILQSLAFKIFLNALIVVYLISALTLFVYSANCYIMIFLFKRRVKNEMDKNLDFLKRFPINFWKWLYVQSTLVIVNICLCLYLVPTSMNKIIFLITQEGFQEKIHI